MEVVKSLKSLDAPFNDSKSESLSLSAKGFFN